MATFGRGSGRFLRDVEIHFPAVLGLGAVAVEILQDSPEMQISIPSECFVFAVRNKEQFMCFCEAGDDPPVKSYMSGNSKLSTVANTFGDFIFAELEMSEYHYAQVRGTPYDLFP